MYPVVLMLHSWMRWAAIVGGVGAMLAVWRGRDADRWSLALMFALDLQLVLGLVLYLVLSPYTARVPSSVEVVMRNPVLRFWNVEHLALMLAAIVAVHVGRALARKAPTATARRTRLLLCVGGATLLMLAGTPWPGSAQARPLFRWSL
jgi:hypothetical protein